MQCENLRIITWNAYYYDFMQEEGTKKDELCKMSLRKNNKFSLANLIKSNLIEVLIPKYKTEPKNVSPNLNFV